MRRLALCLVVLMAVATTAWAAQPRSKPAKARVPAKTQAKLPAKGAEARTEAKSGKPGETRTLQDIHIEGEIPVPQVLFITARDQRRFVDFQTRRYLKTSQEVGTQTAFPSRIVVIGSQPADAQKETRP